MTDPPAAMDQACAMAATDFAQAAGLLRPALAAATVADVGEWVARRWSIPDAGAIACAIYLLLHAHSAEFAAAAGWHALALGCDDDGVVIALADALQAQLRPRQTAARMMHERCGEHRSTAFLVKLADHYRTGGQAFLAEDLLRDLVRRGRRDLMLRLAQLWIETQDWRSARDLLRQLTPEQTSAETFYYLGRSGASLLLEDEVLAAVERLAGMTDPGPRYAALLGSVWTWRVGRAGAAVASCPEVAWPPLIARDAASLRSAEPDCEAAPAGGVWRDLGARADLPNVLGIGMQRCATTWLWRQLGRHPDVQSLTFKELVFFNDPFGSPDRMARELRDPELGEAGRLYWQGPTRNLHRYRRLFAQRKPCRIDISPSYGELPETSVAWVRKLLGPDVRIILSVRDPVERSWSNLLYNLRATGADAAGLSFAERTALYRNVATLRRCDYAAVLRTWRGFFEHIQVVFMDDIVSRPADLLAELRHFIGLSAPADGGCLDPVNATDGSEMPREDRLFLFGLHQATYDAAEAELGGPALGWRQLQVERLG